MSSMLVASHGITMVSSSSASSFIFPNLRATGALVSVIAAPCSTHFFATAQAIDFSSSAPNTMPLLPFSKLLLMIIGFMSVLFSFHLREEQHILN